MLIICLFLSDESNSSSKQPTFFVELERSESFLDYMLSSTFGSKYECKRSQIYFSQTSRLDCTDCISLDILEEFFDTSCLVELNMLEESDQQYALGNKQHLLQWKITNFFGFYSQKDDYPIESKCFKLDDGYQLRMSEYFFVCFV